MKTLLFLLLTVTACGQSELTIGDSASDTFGLKHTPINFYPLWVDGGERSSLKLDTCGVITIKGDTMHVIKQMIMGLLNDYTIEFRDPEISATKGMRTEYNYADTLSGILWKWSSDSVTWGSYLARQEIVIDTVPPDTSVIYFSGVDRLGFGKSPNKELHIVADTIPDRLGIPGTNYNLTVPTNNPGWLKGWERQETKWTEHVEVLSDPSIKMLQDAMCIHDWVFEGQNEYGAMSVCAVLHGPCGCPDAWHDRKQICSQCGLHLRVYRTCEVVKDTRETYEDVVKRFKD